MAPDDSPVEIVVVLAGDRAYAMPIAATVASLAIAHHDDPCRVVVFHDGFDVEVRKRITHSAQGTLPIDWIDARSAVLGQAQMPSHLPVAALFRLRVADLLPTEVERVIYLDSDLVVSGSLRQMWETPLGDAAVGAVRDAKVPWFGAPGGLPWRDLAVAPGTEYFNSGALVIPLAAWRSDDIAGKVFEVLGRHRLSYGDQCGLNVVLADRWHRLDPRWNLQSAHLSDLGLAWVTEPVEILEAARSDPAVVHFVGPTKPWMPGCTHPMRSAWFHALDATPWADWRPKEPSKARRAITRVKRAMGTLRGR